MRLTLPKKIVMASGTSQIEGVCDRLDGGPSEVAVLKSNKQVARYDDELVSPGRRGPFTERTNENGELSAVNSLLRRTHLDSFRGDPTPLDCTTLNNPGSMEHKKRGVEEVERRRARRGTVTDQHMPSDQIPRAAGII